MSGEKIRFLSFEVFIFIEYLKLTVSRDGLGVC
jgi:hypothetical protein